MSCPASANQVSASRRIFPVARFRVIQNAGHLVHLEQPDELLKVLQAFLDDEQPPPSPSSEWEDSKWKRPHNRVK